MTNVRRNLFQMKTCNKCEQIKNETEFYSGKKIRDGKSYVWTYRMCKLCWNDSRNNRKPKSCECEGGLGGDGLATERWRGTWVCKECKRRDQLVLRWSDGYVEFNSREELV